MAEVKELVPSVQEMARLCPVKRIKDSIMDAAIDFCRRSLVWRVQTTDDIVAGTDTYTLAMPTGAAIGAIEIVTVDGIQIPMWTSPWPHSSTSGGAVFYGVNQDKQVRLYPIPAESVTDGLVVSVVAIPDKTGTVIPDFLLDDYKDAIVSGALASVMAIIGQPWANAQVAMYHQKMFSRAIGGARIAIMRAMSTSSISLSLRPII